MKQRKKQQGIFEQKYGSAILSKNPHNATRQPEIDPRTKQMI